MSEVPGFSEVMEAYAQDAVDLARQNFQVTLDFSETSIEAVETILDRYSKSIPRNFLQRRLSKSPSAHQMDQVCKMFGAYIGEVFRRKCGGRWEFDSQTPTGNRVMCLRDGEKRIWPAVKVLKRIKNGPDENVLHYFQAIGSYWTEKPNS